MIFCQMALAVMLRHFRHAFLMDINYKIILLTTASKRREMPLSLAYFIFISNNSPFSLPIPTIFRTFA